VERTGTSLSANMADVGGVIECLLDPERSDPSIRWQVIRDLLDVPEPEWGGGARPR
jgi:hypothetical protein